MNCCTSGLSKPNDIKYPSHHRHKYVQFNKAFKFAHHNHLQYSNDIERADSHFVTNPISFYDYNRNRNPNNETIWILRENLATNQQNIQQQEQRGVEYKSEFQFLNKNFDEQCMQSNSACQSNFELSSRANKTKKSNSKCVHYAPILTQGKYIFYFLFNLFHYLSFSCH